MLPKRKVSIIPSLFTLGNLLCGLGSIWHASKALALVQGAEMPGRIQSGNDALLVAAWLIFLGMVFDSFDGQIARLTGSVSQFGKELDSLADMITFGVAPAFLIEVLSFNNADMFGVIHSRERMLLSAAYAVFAALRLAKYNVDATDKIKTGSRYFNGLPSPAAAGILAALVLVFCRVQYSSSDFANILMQWSPIIAAAIGILMVSGLKFPHFGNFIVRSKLSFQNMVVAAAVILLLIFLREYMLFSGFVAYLLVSVVIAVIKLFKRDDDVLPIEENDPDEVDE